MDGDSSDECFGSTVYQTFSDSSDDDAFQHYTPSSRKKRKLCLLDTVQQNDLTVELNSKSIAIDTLLLKKQKARKVDEMEKSLKKVDKESKNNIVVPNVKEQFKAMKIVEIKKDTNDAELDYSEDLTIFKKENRFKSFCSCLVLGQISNLSDYEVSHIMDSLRENNLKHIHCQNKQKIMMHMCLKLYSTCDDYRILMNLENFTTIYCQEMDFNLKYVDSILSNFGFADNIFTSENQFECGVPCAMCSKNYVPEQMIDKLVFIIGFMTQHCKSFKEKDQILLKHWLRFLLLLLKVQNYPNLTITVQEALISLVDEVKDWKLMMFQLLKELCNECKDFEIVEKILTNLPLVGCWEEFGKFASFFSLNNVLGNNIDLHSVYKGDLTVPMSFESLCCLIVPDKMRKIVAKLKQQNDSEFTCKSLRIFVNILNLCVNSLTVNLENSATVQRLEDYIKKFQGMLRHNGKVAFSELIVSISHIYSSLYYKEEELKLSSNASINYFKNFSQQPAEVSQINCSATGEHVIKLSPMSSEDTIS